MTMFYSKTGGFFTTDVHTEAQIPEDAVEISVELHKSLISAQSNGQAIVCGTDGLPVAVDRDPPTEDELKAQANLIITNQIAALERDKQPRAMREFLIDGNKTRLEELNTQIANLRAQLQ